MGLPYMIAEETSATQPWSLIRDIENHQGIFTVEDLAQVLRLSTCTIYRMAQHKRLSSLRIGGSRMFDPAALGMHFRKRSPESAADAQT